MSNNIYSELALPIHSTNVPNAQDYPSEETMENKSTAWYNKIQLCLFLWMILLIVLLFFKNECEKKEKSSFLQPINVVFWYIISESWGLLIWGWNHCRWYLDTNLFGITKSFIVFQLVNMTMFVLTIISLSGVWSKCPHSHLVFVYISLAYRPSIMIFLGYILYKYPLLIGRIVWKKEELQPFNR